MALPLQSPLHKALLFEVITVRRTGSVITIESLDEQPKLSLTITLKVFAHNPVAVAIA